MANFFDPAISALPATLTGLANYRLPIETSSTDYYGTLQNLPWSFKTAFVVSRNDELGDYICDGVDDHVQIQQALDAASAAGGGTVLLKAGTYDIGASLTIAANVWLKGEGSPTHLRQKDATGIDLIQVEGTNHPTVTAMNVRITDLRLNGNKANQTLDHYNLRVRSCSNVLVRGVETENAKRASSEGNGMYFTNSQDVLVTECISHDNEGLGFHFTNDFGASINCYLTNCTAYDNGNDNILMWRAESCWIDRCTSRNAGTDGITIHGAEVVGAGTKRSGVTNCLSEGSAEDSIVACTAGEECIIANNICKTGGNDGINVFWNAARVIVSNNVVVNHARYGIWIQGKSDGLQPIDRCIVANNIVQDSDNLDTDQYSNIAIGFASSNCIVIGNISTGATSNYGVNVGAGTAGADPGVNNMVIGNHLVGNKFGGIRDNAVNTYISGNVESAVRQTESKWFGTLIPEARYAATTGGPTYADRPIGNLTRPVFYYPTGVITEAAFPHVLAENYLGSSIRLSSGLRVRLIIFSRDNESGLAVALGISIERTNPEISSMNLNGWGTETVIIANVAFNAGSSNVTTTVDFDLDHATGIDDLEQGEMFRVRVRRVGTNPSDTLTGDMGLFAVLIGER